MADFTISVDRIGYGQRDIVVKNCDTQEQAEAKALDEAGGYEFSEHHSDYVLSNRPTPKEQRLVDASETIGQAAMELVKVLERAGLTDECEKEIQAIRDAIKQ